MRRTRTAKTGAAAVPGAVRLLPVIPLSALFVLGFPGEAAAYLDPSSGGLLLQLILGGTAGVAMLGKMYFRKVLGFVRRRPADSEQELPAEPRTEQ